jgi:pyrimidine deaminase RibD-like protein
MTPDEAMHHALTEGRRALPRCLPNPPVGAILTRGETILARGHTQPPGLPHAEALVLSQVDGALSDCMLHVTLEPCSFHGRTPSCAEALIERGIRFVSVAMVDPDPRNAGKGLELLRAAGIAVFVGTCAVEARREMGDHLNLPANRY